MRIVLSRLRGKQVVSLFPESKSLRIKVAVGGVRGGGTNPTIVSELDLSWEDVLSKLGVRVKTPAGQYHWNATIFADQK
jgi:hypothetical protein